MARRFPIYSNRTLSATLASATDDASTITLRAGDGALFPSPGAGEYVPAVLLNRVSGAYEEINITERSGDVLTVERAQGGTSAIEWDADTEIFVDVPARELHDAQGHVARSFPTMAEAIADDKYATVEGRYCIVGGTRGGRFEIATGLTADGGIVIDVNGGAQQIVRQYEGAVNVKWFGAVGDGSTDDSAAIQACLNAAAAGSTVIFPSGTYLVSSALASSGSLFVVGPGTIRSAVDGDLWNHTGSLDIRDIVFDGNDNAVVEVLLECGGSAGDVVRVTQCAFKNIDSATFGHGLRFKPSDAFSEIHVRGCSFSDLRALKNDVIGDVNGAVRGIYVGAAASLLEVVDCTFDNINSVDGAGNNFQEDGDAIHTGPDVDIARTIFSGLLFNDIGKRAIKMQSPGEYSIRDCDCVSGWSYGGSEGMHVVFESFAGTRCDIRDCRASGGPMRYFFGSATGGDRAYLSNCRFEPDSVQLQVQGSDTRFVVVQDDDVILEDCVSINTTRGATFNDGIERLRMKNCKITTTHVGLYFDSAGMDAVLENCTLIQSPAWNGGGETSRQGMQFYDGVARLRVVNTKIDGYRQALYILTQTDNTDGAYSIEVETEQWSADTLILDQSARNHFNVVERRSLIEGRVESVSTASPTLSRVPAVEIDASSNAVNATLPDGSHIGQRITIVMTDATNPSTVSVTTHETSSPEVFTFDAVDEYAIFEWVGPHWVTIKATATV